MRTISNDPVFASLAVGHDLHLQPRKGESVLLASRQPLVRNQLSSSTQPWQIIGNQTLLHFQSAPNFAATRVLPPSVREPLLAGIQQLLGGPAALAQYNQPARGRCCRALAIPWC